MYNSDGVNLGKSLVFNERLAWLGSMGANRTSQIVHDHSEANVNFYDIRFCSSCQISGVKRIFIRTCSVKESHGSCENCVFRSVRVPGSFYFTGVSEQSRPTRKTGKKGRPRKYVETCVE